ncbi:extracellular solute-binding protein [Saliphagus sp. LR7]|uniref:extracellular solute-binding protein n=1 Tax=Saliphagus sp. LR7 TaxID=2282654 RepID=UPI000DF7CF9A|nr:extracellular solute-binding protein [Saliphagus sp. LR7]
MTSDSNHTRRRFIEGTAGLSTAAIISLAGCVGGLGGNGDGGNGGNGNGGNGNGGNGNGGNGNGSNESDSGNGGNGNDSGNGGNGSDGGNGGGGGTVKFWSSPNQQELTFHESAAEEFGADSDVSVDVSPVPEGDSSEQVVLSSLASGTEPDVFANVFPGFAAQLEANEAATDLYELDGVEEFLTERCGEELLSQYESPDGGLYQTPWKTNPVLFQYNDTVFEEAGYSQEDYPRTFSALLEEGPNVVESSSAEVLWDRPPMPTWSERWFDFLPIYLAASQGEESMFTQEDGQTTPAFNNDTAVQVLEFFQQLYENDLIPQESTEEPKFPNDLAAINTGGPWVIPYFQDVNEEISMSHLTPPVPEGVEQNSHTYADPKNTSIFQSSDVAPQAWSFIEYELGEERDVTFMEDTLQIPLRADITDVASSFFEENPQVQPYAEALETSHPPAYTPAYTQVMNIFGEEAFVPVTRGNQDPQTGLDRAEEQITSELE